MSDTDDRCPAARALPAGRIRAGRPVRNRADPAGVRLGLLVAAGARARAGRRGDVPDRAGRDARAAAVRGRRRRGGRDGVHAGRPGRRVQPGHRLRLPAHRRDRHGAQRRRRPLRAARRAGRTPPAAAVRACGASARGDQGQRARHPPGQQLLLAGGVRDRPADLGGGVDPGRQLVVLSPTQARPGTPGRGGARGDLLLRGRPRAGWVGWARRARRDGHARGRVPARLLHRPGPADRRAGRGPGRRRRAGAARLPRPVDGGARLRLVLPERAGGPRAAAVDGVLRRSRARLDPAELGRPAAGPEAADVRGRREPGGAVRLTVGQALVRFLVAQHSERDGVRQRFFAGCWGIFGHGNVAGLGEALLEASNELRYYQGRNEQAMVHAAVGYARMKDRLQAFACTSSIGPGATNMVTGAALATVNRIPVLLLPGDVFATRAASPLLQELEDPRTLDVSVNDCLRPVSPSFARIWPPPQPPAAPLPALRVLPAPAATGAVPIPPPQHTAAEAHDWPEELFADRVWRIRRPRPEPQAMAEAVAAIRRSGRPLLVAGGGVHYSDATAALRELAEQTGIPVAETQAGKGALPYDHPAALGAIGATGTTAANATAREADLVIGAGTR